jgi:hypothetical protein
MVPLCGMLRWFDHLVVVDCPPGCPYCARNAAKKESPRGLDRRCLEAVFDLGGQADTYAIVRKVYPRCSKRQVSWVYYRLNKLLDRGLLNSRVASRKADKTQTLRLWRLQPSGLRALRKPPLAFRFDEEHAQTLDLFLRSHGELTFRGACIGIGICFEISSAHRQNVTHGDIRPQNILVTPDLDVKLINFSGEPDQDKTADLQRIRGLLRQLVLYAGEQQDLERISKAAALDEEDFPDAGEIQRRLEGMVDNAEEPLSPFDWVGNVMLAMVFIVIGLFVWVKARPDIVPTWLADWLLSGYR